MGAQIFSPVEGTAIITHKRLPTGDPTYDNGLSVIMGSHVPDMLAQFVSSVDEEGVAFVLPVRSGELINLVLSRLTAGLSLEQKMLGKSWTGSGPLNSVGATTGFGSEAFSVVSWDPVARLLVARWDYTVGSHLYDQAETTITFTPSVALASVDTTFTRVVPSDQIKVINEKAQVEAVSADCCPDTNSGGSNTLPLATDPSTTLIWYFDEFRRGVYLNDDIFVVAGPGEWKTMDAVGNETFSSGFVRFALAIRMSDCTPIEAGYPVLLEVAP